MTKTLALALTLATLTGSASAQQRTFYSDTGSVVGKSFTYSNGYTKTYDNRGNVVSRQVTSGNQTKVYDASGNKIGTIRTRQ